LEVEKMIGFAKFLRRWSQPGLRSRRIAARIRLGMEILESRVTPSATWAFDFGPPDSPVATGYTGVGVTAYSSAQQYGWQDVTGLTAVSRSGPDVLRQDFVSGTDATFLADVPNGTYDVVATLGDNSAVRDQVTASAEGTPLAAPVTSQTGQFLPVRGRITVTDGQLSLRVSDAGSVNNTFALDALTISPVNNSATGLFDPTDQPQSFAVNDYNQVNLGIRFSASTDGFISGIRYFKGAQDTGTHVGHLWTKDGQLLATAVFTNETSSGWQQVNFSQPVPVTANTQYIASYHSNGYYPHDFDYFTVSGKASGVLYAPVTINAYGVGNGLFHYGPDAFPAETYEGINYWVDVVFQPQNGDTTPPTVVSVTPANGTTGVPTDSQVQITFSEALDPSTVNGSTLELDAPGNVPVPSNVSYNASSFTATITPLSPLANNTPYTVVAHGGATDPRIKDLAGNALAATFTSTFTTVDIGAPPTANAGPDQTSNEGSAVQFNGSATGSGTLSYSWTFGDGAGANGTLTPSHIYADNGTYLATLTVTDSFNRSAQASAVITVNNVAPTATLSNSGPVPVNSPVTISFSNQFDPSSVDTTAGFKYSYDFNNDGNFELTDVPSASASTTFATAGTYVVRGRIKDKDGGFTDYTTSVTVNNATVGRTFYVAPSGNDNGSGTADSPWATLQHAADSVQAGDTVIVRAGTYAGFVLGWNFPQNGTPDAPITFRADPGTIINARNSVTADGINLEGTSYIVIDGFTINNATGTISRAGIRSVTNNHVTIRNNNVDSAGLWGIFTGFSDDLLIENNVTSRSINQHGIYVSNSGDRPIIRGNVVWGNRDSGIQLNADVSQGGDGIISNALVESNIIHDNGIGGGSAINADGVQNSVFRNNLLYDNHASGISLFMIDGAAGSINNVVANNTIVLASDGRWALNIQNGSTGNTVFNNIIYNLSSHGSIDISADSLPGFTSDYNVVMDRFTLNDGASTLSLGQWRAQTGQDQHSLISTPAALFVDPANNDYRLKAGSPAINAGTATFSGASAPTTDILGNPRPFGGLFDIGAYEFTG
jgi:hypothetical protein